MSGATLSNMTVGPTYHSEEELVKRLQIVVKDIPAGSGNLVRFDSDMRELRNLVEELAARIYDDPQRWGLAPLPTHVRDDAAADAFMALLEEAPNFRAHQPVVEWFLARVEERSRELAAIQEEKAPAPARQSGAKRGKATSKPGHSVPPVFKGDLWRGFEEESPREAFVLRLRYLLDRTPEEMAEMLEAPSARSIGMRLNRARDRFRIYCEQHGSDLRATEALLAELGEARKR